MKIPRLARPIERRPEESGWFADPLEVEAFRRESAHGLVQLIERRFVASALRRVGEGRTLRVLDVGSGPGWIPMMLARERPSWEICAIDTSRPMLRIAEEEARSKGLHIEWVQALAGKTPFRDGLFDLVVSHLAFSEFADPGAALRDMRRVLDRHGWLIIQDLLRPPRWQFPILVLLRRLARPFDRWSGRYVDRLKGAYSASEVADLVRAAGLGSARVRTFRGSRGGMWRVEARDTAYRSLLADGRSAAPERRRPHGASFSAPTQGAASLGAETVTGPEFETVSAIVETARWAPTPDNWQTWRFHWTGECLEVYWDFEAGTSFLDVDHCMAFMSIGGAVANMEIVAAREGLAPVVDLSPERRSNRPAARIFLEPAPARPSDLEAVIRQRCTNRRPYARTQPRAEVIERLMAAGRGSTRVRLEVLCERGEIEALASLAGEFDGLFLRHREIHDAIFRWIRWTEAEALKTLDGLPLSSLEPSRSDVLAMHLIRHWSLARLAGNFGLRRYLARRARELYSSSGAFGILSLAGPTAQASFEAGRIMEEVWLVSTHEGLALQPIAGLPLLIMRNCVKDGEGLPESIRAWAAGAEERIRSLAHLEKDQLPVLLFRVGEAPLPSARAQRRPLASLFS